MSDHSEITPHTNGSALPSRAVRRNKLEPLGPVAQDEFIEEDGFDFWQTFSIIWRRKWMILAVTILGVALAVVVALRQTPLYKAAATIEVQKQATQILDSNPVDPVLTADSEFMATQYELLQSRSLAERISEQLDLASDPRYADQSLTRPQRLIQSAAKIVDNVRVSPAGRSRVIQVEYISPHRGETARIANALVENFIQTNLERRYNTTAYARRFIQEQLAITKSALEKSERELVAYADQEGILELSESSEGASLDETSIRALNQAAAVAEEERIDAEQSYREAVNNPVIREALESEDLKQLRLRRSQLSDDYIELQGTFKPDYPDMVRLQNRLAAIDQDIAREQANLVSALEAEYRAAVAKEAALRARVEELKLSLQDLRDRRIEYTILAREVDTNRSQYDALLQRMKEVSVASGVGSSQVSIIDSALVPGAPFEPNLPRTVLQALVLSLALGFGLAFALNYIDDTIKSPDDVKSKLGLPAIGVIPKVTGSEDLVTVALRDPKSVISEAFFSARTALQFTTETGAPRSLVVTSTRPAEGKTSSTVALAMSFAKIGQNVLIIDADMRKPSFVADAGASIGLSGMLTKQADLQQEVVQSGTDGLYLLPAGIIPPNPAELLSSPRLGQLISDAERLFDIVIIDSPPVLSFADAPLLGSICEGALVVVQANGCRVPAVRRTIDRMLENNSNLIGCVLTKFDTKRAGYEYGYDYAYSGAYAYRETAVPNSAERQRKVRMFSQDDQSKDDQRL